jgi:copper chaperone CopZ
MSRRRGEFEHRTSIFEGAFRAWSHLGGLDPIDLESKAMAELDPLNFPIINDIRLTLQKEKDSKKKAAKEGGSGNNSPTFLDDSGDGGNYSRLPRIEYPYEPLPRSGLAHPFVQAILSPWLGPDADQDAIQLGLTTLRTWWQHRRKGESGSAVVALGTEKMQGVVEGYTRHFFNLAHCLIVHDKEQPPRSLQAKMRDLEKTRGKKGGKKRARESTSEDDAIKAAAMAFNSGFGGGVAPVMSSGPVDAGGMNGAGAGVGGDSMLTPLERLQAAQARQLASVGGVHSSLAGGMGMETTNSPPQIDMKGQCMPGRIDLPGLVQQVSRAATQLAHRGIRQSSAPGVPVPAVDPSKYGDPNITPIVLVSQNGDSQICMTIEGITCAHCVKIVETVLKGCQGNRSPIDGVLDAAGDMELALVLIRIEKAADARRIAFEAARNLTMVGYTAVAKSMNITEVAAKGNNEVTLQTMNSAFESLPHLNPMTVMNWELECSCPDNNVTRQDCAR